MRWVNAAGGNIHNVTSGNTAFASQPNASSFTFEVTFNNPGDFPYECTLHFGMSGSITVTGEADPDVELVSVNALDEGEGVQVQRISSGSVTRPEAIGQGEPLTIEALIRNNGDSASAGFDITYYASSDAVITAGDTSLGSFSVAGFAGGAMSTVTDTVTIPNSLPAGQYFIGATLSIDDPDDANNTDVDATSVQITGPFFINSGLNDAWVIDGVRRQGILIAVLPSALPVPVFFAAWFTYDVERPPLDVTAMLGEPGHRWVTLQGSWTGDTANLQVYVTAGGVFAAADPLPNNAVSIGTMTIEFHDCSSATATFNIPFPAPIGNIPAPGLGDTLLLTRSDANNIAICEELNLALQEDNG